MSREIKFRAWDRTVNTMCGVGEIHFCAGGLLIEGMGVHLGKNKPNDESIVLMQYTGLKDKNNKEIYEGDIVKHGDFNALVVYQAPSFVMKKKQRNKTWWEFISAPFTSQFEEVIGNIYENPELVETDNESTSS